MSEFLGFTQEEKELIDTINELLKSRSKSKQLLMSMIAFADDNISSQGLLYNEHNLRFLNNFTESPEIKVMVDNLDDPKKCPCCNTLLEADCGRFFCYECRLTFFLETPSTRGVCPGCMYYRDPNDPDNDKSKQQGFGAGCPGVYMKGNEFDLYKENKPLYFAKHKKTHSFKNKLNKNG